MEYPLRSTFLYYLGCSVAVIYTLRLVASLYRGLRMYVIGGGVDLSTYGPWAVITGSTDGIGKEYAFQLAKRGLNILLIARNPEKLKTVAEEIISFAKVETKTIVADFQETDIYETIAEGVKDLDVGVLVNNVGVSYTHPEYILDYGDKMGDNFRHMINVNCVSMAVMTKIVMPRMVTRGRGIVINVSSMACLVYTPLLAVYSATKVFADYFSSCLSYEYRNTDIIIQEVVPFFISTKMSGIRRATFWFPSAKVFVSSQLRTLGTGSRTFGYWPHAINAFFTENILPQWVSVALGYRWMQKFRKRAIQKKMKRN